MTRGPRKPPTRLVPDLPLPAYAHVPGRTVRPAQAGHMPDMPLPSLPVDPEQWRRCTAFLYGVDLFNAGYFWEAHEAWEALWQACGRKGQPADFLKGLIALAAAGVKVRQEKPEGIERHAARAGRLFRETQAAYMAPDGRYFGLALDDLIDLADALSARVLPSGTADCEALVTDLRMHAE